MTDITKALKEIAQEEMMNYTCTEEFRIRVRAVMNSLEPIQEDNYAGLQWEDRYPLRSNEKWSDGEDKVLQDALSDFIRQRARKHKRSTGAIISRINKHISIPVTISIGGITVTGT